MTCSVRSEQSHRIIGGSGAGNPKTANASAILKEGKQLRHGASARNVRAGAEDWRTRPITPATISTKMNGRISRSANRIIIPVTICTTKDSSGVRCAGNGFRRIANVGPASLQKKENTRSIVKNHGEEIGTHITGDELRKRTRSGRRR